MFFFPYKIFAFLINFWLFLFLSILTYIFILTFLRMEIVIKTSKTRNYYTKNNFSITFSGTKDYACKSPWDYFIINLRHQMHIRSTHLRFYSSCHLFVSYIYVTLKLKSLSKSLQIDPSKNPSFKLHATATIQVWNNRIASDTTCELMSLGQLQGRSVAGSRVRDQK